MIITQIKRAALITAMTGIVGVGGTWALGLGDVADQWARQAEIETMRSEKLAEIEVVALATAHAQGAALKELEIEEKQLELIVMRNDATRANQMANVSQEIEIERKYQLAWVWTTSKGLAYGMVGLVPTALGGLILWRVIAAKRRDDEDGKLINVMAAGAIPVSREFMLNEPERMFEFAMIRAEMDARAKLAKAEQPHYPNLTTWTQAPTTTYSPTTSTTTTNDKELLMMGQARQLESEEDNNKGAEGEKSTIIFELLEGHGVPAYVKLLATGPQVETFSIRPGRKIVKNRMKRITVREITKYEADIAMALGVANVRIEQHGGYLACEVARKEREFVSMEEMIRSSEWLAAMKDMALPLALGRNTLGEDVIMDLCTMPHFLAGGATSMGKSVLIRSIIASLALQPVDKVRLVLVDPKEVEFEPFRPIPHVSQIITDMDLAANSLESALLEMDRRSKLFKAKGVQKISEYNDAVTDKLPYIVIIIDELADLMATNKDQVEDLIVRIAIKARFAGIHLILATQRPDADTVTPQIRANVPARCSVRTMTSGDSRTILDAVGAEKLLDQGDSLIKSAQTPLMRMQSAYISMNGAIKEIKLALSTNKQALKALGDSGTGVGKVRDNSGKDAGKVMTPVLGNKSGKQTTEQTTEQKPTSQVSSCERTDKIRMMLADGKSATAIIKAVWGHTGGRKDKARRQEISTIKAELDLVG